MEKNLKFVGIKVSGRKNGNSAIILNELLKPAKEAGYEVEEIDLIRYNLRPCTGCFGCNNKELECVLKDDLKSIHEKIAAADAIAIASPCYGIGAPSNLKTVIDRSAIWNMTAIVDNDKKKYGAAVSVGGGDSDWMSLQRIFPSLLLEFYNCEIIGQFNIEKTGLKGEVLLSPSKLKEVEELGKSLLKSTEDEIPFKSKTNNLNDKLVCPNCYSDIFRIQHSKDGGFRATEHYKCAVCNIKIDRFEKFDKLLTSFANNPEKFDKSRFTEEETLAHFEHIGNKIISGIDATEEVNARLEKYLQDNVLPETDYAREVEGLESESVEWDDEATEAFKQAVPRVFQRFVKKAIEQKAVKNGEKRITKELFLKTKREAGF